MRQTHTHHIHCALREAKSQGKAGREGERNDKLRVCANACDRDSERARDAERESFFLVRQSCHRLQYTIVLVCEQASNDEQYTQYTHSEAKQIEIRNDQFDGARRLDLFLSWPFLHDASILCGFTVCCTIYVCSQAIQFS